MDEPYELVQDGDLEQGDFIRDLSVYIQDSPENYATPQPGFDHFPLAIIMSQSCDLQPQRGQEFALVCPVYTVDQLYTSWGGDRLGSRWDEARKGNSINYHPLPACSKAGHEREAAMVEFPRVFEMKIDRLRGLCDQAAPWLRLKTPYREQMAQQFAVKIMRIGLPVRVPEWSEIGPGVRARAEATASEQQPVQGS